MESEAAKRKKRADNEKARVRRRDDTFQKALEMLKSRKGKHREPIYLTREEILQRFCKQYIHDFPAVLENTKVNNNLRMRRSINENGVVSPRFVTGRFKHHSKHEQVKNIYKTRSDKNDGSETIFLDSTHEVAVCSTPNAQPSGQKFTKHLPSIEFNVESSSSSSSSGLGLPSFDTTANALWWAPSSKVWTLHDM